MTPFHTWPAPGDTTMAFTSSCRSLLASRQRMPGALAFLVIFRLLPLRLLRHVRNNCIIPVSPLWTRTVGARATLTRRTRSNFRENCCLRIWSRKWNPSRRKQTTNAHDPKTSNHHRRYSANLVARLQYKADHCSHPSVLCTGHVPSMPSYCSSRFTNILVWPLIQNVLVRAIGQSQIAYELLQSNVLPERADHIGKQ